MTKKDYVIIADGIINARRLTADSILQSEEVREFYQYLIYSLSKNFEANNERFDSYLFEAYIIKKEAELHKLEA